MIFRKNENVRMKLQFRIQRKSVGDIHLRLAQPETISLFRTFKVYTRKTTHMSKPKINTQKDIFKGTFF